MVEEDAGEEWNSGEEIRILLTDGDLNLNTAADDDQKVANMTTVPTIIVGSPLYMDLNPDCTNTCVSPKDASGNGKNFTTTIDATTKIATLTHNATSTVYGIGGKSGAGGSTADADRWTILSGHTHTDVNNMNTSKTDTRVASWDVSSLCVDNTIAIGGHGNAVGTAAGLTNKGSLVLTAPMFDGYEDITCQVHGNQGVGFKSYVTIDFMAFGAADHDGIYRVEVEETENDSGVFEGNVEYIMLNQLTYDQVSNSAQVDTFFNITTIGDGVDIILC
jgi:hypothetical protein